MGKVDNSFEGNESLGRTNGPRRWEADITGGVAAQEHRLTY